MTTPIMETWCMTCFSVWEPDHTGCCSTCGGNTYYDEDVSGIVDVERTVKG